MVIAYGNFNQIFCRIFAEIFVEGSKPNDLKGIYQEFKACPKNYNPSITEQVLIISASISETEGFQHLSEANPIKHKGIWEKIKLDIRSIPKGLLLKVFTDENSGFVKALYPNEKENRLKLCLKMLLLTKALHPNATDDYLKRSLAIHKIAQDCVVEAQNQIKQNRKSKRRKRKSKSKRRKSKHC
eukprot:GHVP01035321.1.p1 GENE.GHVP01035321.1~~GHVP01035321.1.p1  ORF type:complete len:185 (+),score=18.62 GHVP01035321.1:756-1310(+)